MITMILLTKEIEQVANYNYLYVAVGVLALLVLVQFIVNLWDWFCKRFGITTKAIEQEKQEKETIKKTAEDVTKMAESLSKISDTVELLRANQISIDEDITNLKINISDSSEKMNNISDEMSKLSVKIADLDERTKAYELSDTRNELLKQYRFFTSDNTNPLHQWTEIEKDSFDEHVKAYEAAGGNSYVHTIVVPEMNRLGIVYMSDTAGLKQLFASRSSAI